MAVCVKAVQQQDGTLLLALDPAATDLSTCPYVVEDGSSTAWRELGNMTVSDAQVVGLSMVVIWAMAWAYKFLGRLISNFNSESES